LKKFTAIFLTALLLVGIVAMSGCSKKEAAQQQEPQEKVMKIITEASFAPFEFKEGNDFVGFDIEVINAICEDQGYKAEITHMGFDSLIPALQAGKADCAISGMSITDERKKSIDFSDSYFDAGLIIAVAENNNDIKTLDDLQGKKIAGQVGTIGADACNAVKAKDPKTEIRTFDAIGEAFMELEKGGVDAVINDQAVTAYYIQTTGKGKTKMVGDLFSADDHYGIAVKKGNAEMLKVINDGLASIRANGKYDEIYQKWFGK
jgi:ABC-type amino acid transport substrate-binding protein